MKRTTLLPVLLLALVIPAGALDSEKLAAFEKEGAVLMQTLAPAELQTLETRWGTPGSDPKAQLFAGIVAHNLSRAVPGKGWATKAVQRLKAPSEGSNAELGVVALAYLGSSKALQANEDLNPVSKITLVNQGWELLDQAVAKAGDSTFLPRYLRASVGQSLPDFFGKAPVVVTDTRALQAWAQAHPQRIDAALLAQFALMEANALKKTKDLDGAIVAWKKALALDPDRKGPGKAAAAALELYED